MTSRPIPLRAAASGCGRGLALLKTEGKKRCVERYDAGRPVGTPTGSRRAAALQPMEAV